MIIVKLTGRLGNQMFQYALALHLALKNRGKIIFDLNELLYKYPSQKANYQRDYNLAIFNIPCRRATQREIDRFLFNPRKRLNVAIRKTKNFFNPHYIVRERQFNFDENVLQNNSRNIYLEGFWQSEKYFIDISSHIRKVYTLNIDVHEKIKGIEKEILNNNSVCINIRRGDYILPENIGKFGVLGLDYYKKGLEIISASNNDLKIFVFSDDIEWCRENLTFEYPTVFMTSEDDGSKSILDFKLMTLCKHFVIPNSTFAWWAAWLCANPSKIVVAPEKWFVTDEINYSDVVPETWIKI